MRLTLLESNRSFFQVAECAAVSILAHAGLVWFLVAGTGEGWKLPTTEREARVVFLLPPDRVDERSHQSEIIQWGKLGLDFEDGKRVTGPDEGWFQRQQTHGIRKRELGSGAKGKLPFGPPPQFVPDTAWSVLEVDKIAERYEDSAAPIYPRELLALGMEGTVRTTYVVDTTGMVDTTTVQVLWSDDPRFTESVRNALGQTHFRPAIRAGKTVRQLVEQQFRFKILPPEEFVKQVS
jgi:TonB family protein